jgi:hypothetical protein
MVKGYQKRRDCLLVDYILAYFQDFVKPVFS